LYIGWEENWAVFGSGKTNWFLYAW